MTAARAAWSVVLIAELARSSEDLLRRAMRLLDPDARAAMPADGGWTLDGSEAEELRRLLREHADNAERLESLAVRVPEQGVVATYSDVRDGAAEALADGILDPHTLMLATRALDVQTGWVALAEALASTDARCGWSDLRVEALLAGFRNTEAQFVRRALAEADVDADSWWTELDDQAIRRLAGALATYAART